MERRDAFTKRRCTSPQETPYADTYRPTRRLKLDDDYAAFADRMSHLRRNMHNELNEAFLRRSSESEMNRNVSYVIPTYPVWPENPFVRPPRDPIYPEVPSPASSFRPIQPTRFTDSYNDAKPHVQHPPIVHKLEGQLPSTPTVVDVPKEEDRVYAPSAGAKLFSVKRRESKRGSKLPTDPSTVGVRYCRPVPREGLGKTVTLSTSAGGNKQEDFNVQISHDDLNVEPGKKYKALVVRGDQVWELLGDRNILPGHPLVMNAKIVGSEHSHSPPASGNVEEEGTGSDDTGVDATVPPLVPPNDDFIHPHV